MPRYEVTLVLTLDAESQHDAAEMAEEMIYAADDMNCLPPGDSSLEIKSISWPVD